LQQCPKASMTKEGHVHAPLKAPLAHAALGLLAVAPLVLPVPTNANIVLTAALTVFVGCWRSVKPEPPPEAMTKKVRAAGRRQRRQARAANVGRLLPGASLPACCMHCVACYRCKRGISSCCCSAAAAHSSCYCL